MIDDGHVLITIQLVYENRLDILAVDFDIPLSSRNIIPVLQNDETHFFKIGSDSIEAFRDRENEIVANNLRGVPSDVFEIFFNGMSRRNIGV